MMPKGGTCAVCRKKLRIFLRFLTFEDFLLFFSHLVYWYLTFILKVFLKAGNTLEQRQAKARGGAASRLV